MATNRSRMFTDPILGLPLIGLGIMSLVSLITGPINQMYRLFVAGALMGIGLTLFVGGIAYFVIVYLDPPGSREVQDVGKQEEAFKK